jgi:hypothetical protein
VPFSASTARIKINPTHDVAHTRVEFPHVWDAGMRFPEVTCSVCLGILVVKHSGSAGRAGLSDRVRDME